MRDRVSRWLKFDDFYFIDILSTQEGTMIHDRIRRARVLRGLSLEEVAQRLGDISKQALSKFEKGGAVPNSTRLLQLAKVLNVKPEYFSRRCRGWRH
jgi:DNA-binding XRE family transcriptional regulator